MLQTKIHVDGDRLVIQNTQDCTPHLEHAKALHNEGAHGSKDFKHAAKLPDIAVQAYLNQHGIEFGEFMSNPVHIKRMLNDPDLKGFRIWPGRV